MSEASAPPVVVVVDVANVMGSRPDGWWRDRAGAATRLLERMPRLVGRTVVGPAREAADGRTDGSAGGHADEPADGALTIARVVAVLEGQAKAAAEPAGIEVVRAPADGDAAIVDVAAGLASAGERLLVVTADRGLRARLPRDARVAGPGWVNDLLGR
ncbi:hypothetical protein GCM10009819_29380 [Agromyces tropicus]|uniref:NTP pyrophosphohydrolase n=1 Tax=Agromyces tropicus TaxID=555371 RepID=A0ABN2UQH0_9MICO